MAEKEEQTKPLSTTTTRSYQINGEHDHAISIDLKKHHHNPKYLKCCGYISALILILAFTILMLIFTVFRVKEPVLNINSGKINGLDRASKNTIRLDTNLTVVADVSIENPNVVAFKFGNTTTTLYYGGVVVGNGRNPAGVAEAGKTVRTNMTIDVMTEKILGVRRLTSDLSYGALGMRSYTSISGGVKILKIIKKNVVVKVNCSMTFNITSQAIQDQICMQHMSF
ncbi:uncharacterized protein LOC114320830 [Camellia sinensis]|uniref:Late embryogenesis abundant protein LEA-2 subgroup domain-containing protein n=1 Tax=Camellia sinensis var. sinensis TaxID=542762 RepID=A0A4S4CWX5_CAMSN|nr:uncharacterized protein LOC114320830 [Camellia sinensis]THF94380.1 hypothetical protein TEA_029363 [Camellia sinensis var. sinensis]